MGGSYVRVVVRGRGGRTSGALGARLPAGAGRDPAGEPRSGLPSPVARACSGCYSGWSEDLPCLGWEQSWAWPYCWPNDARPLAPSRWRGPSGTLEPAPRTAAPLGSLATTRPAAVRFTEDGASSRRPGRADATPERPGFERPGLDGRFNSVTDPPPAAGLSMPAHRYRR